LASVFENGRPSSRAKAQVSRETEARLLKSATKKIKQIAAIRILVPGTDFIAK